MSDQNPQRVLVTAGGSGIGNAIALAFLETGASVHMVDVDAAALAKQGERDLPSSRLLLSEADVSDEAQVTALFERQETMFGVLDVMVNCAGIKGPTGPVEELLLTEWQRCFAVNLEATFLCSKYAIPRLKQQGEGSIINISSTAGWHGYPLRSPYAAAKWGVIGLTKSLAMELGPFGIRANAICPGSVSGDRMDRVIADEAVQKGISEEEIRQGYTKGVSLRCFIEASDIADTAVFLASSAARRITGQAISVDGHLESIGGLDN